MNHDKVILLKLWLEEAMYHNQPNDLESFLCGVELFASDFSIWEDGNRYFGANKYTTRELFKAIKLIKEEYDNQKTQDQEKPN